MSNLLNLLPEKQRSTKEAVNGLTVRADELMALGQYGDAAERLAEAVDACREMAYDLDHAATLARVHGGVA